MKHLCTTVAGQLRLIIFSMLNKKSNFFCSLQSLAINTATLDKNKECGKKMSFFAKYHSVLVVDKFSQKFKNCDIDLKHIYVELFIYILLVVM